MVEMIQRIFRSFEHNNLGALYPPPERTGFTARVIKAVVFDCTFAEGVTDEKSGVGHVAFLKLESTPKRDFSHRGHRQKALQPACVGLTESAHGISMTAIIDEKRRRAREKAAWRNKSISTLRFAV